LSKYEGVRRSRQFLKSVISARNLWENFALRQAQHEIFKNDTKFAVDKISTYFRCMKIIIIIIFCASFLTSCSNKTEQYLRAVHQADTLNFAILKDGYDKNTQNAITQDGLEYGKIAFPNKDTVKYLFMSHHGAEDIGGTLFVLPNGESKFIKGYFCCEVQLPNDGNFSSAEALMNEMEKLDGTEP
jgi:hypothetical protein